jgi:hypothetical protein
VAKKAYLCKRCQRIRTSRGLQSRLCVDREACDAEVDANDNLIKALHAFVAKCGGLPPMEKK